MAESGTPTPHLLGLTPGTVYLADCLLKGSLHITIVAMTDFFAVQHHTIEHIPQPTADPNDPLNWARKRKFLNFFLTFAVTIVIFTQLSIQTVFWQQMIPDLKLDYSQLNNALAVNYAGTACGGVFFVPFAVKYGRRPVYLASTAIMAAVAFWTARIESLSELYATNLFCGLAGSTNETIVQMTIVDLFFVHQRSRMYALYSLAAGIGSFLIPIAAGAQADASGWRWSYWTLAICNTVIFAFFLFAFEETKYLGHLSGQSLAPVEIDSRGPPAQSLKDNVNVKSDTPPSANTLSQVRTNESVYVMRPYKERMRLLTRSSENLWLLFYQPLEALFCFPAVMFSAVQYGFSLAWVAVITSVQSIYMSYEPWNFNTTQIGLLSLPPFIGLLIGLTLGGFVGDKMIVYFAKRNSGVFEPEMRLYAQGVPVVVTTAGFLTFGLCLANFSPWYSNALGTLVYGLGWGCAINSVTFVMDSYTEVTGVAFVGISFVRNIFSVILLFALSPWIEAQGLKNMFITMTVICFVIGMLFIPMILFGKRARRKTAKRYAKMAEAAKAYSRG